MKGILLEDVKSLDNQFTYLKDPSAPAVPLYTEPIHPRI